MIEWKLHEDHVARPNLSQARLQHEVTNESRGAEAGVANMEQAEETLRLWLLDHLLLLLCSSISTKSEEDEQSYRSTTRDGKYNTVVQ
ncbi:hypothetical protein SAY87_032045 [Trapa incisa]|uniref:Uncharacterized protein n=1 Tax=Trapa incisa TaxID=236973 RepID=A0AAN7QNY1_9MYRT|nr:hypothetical protein SAY87_032045 [Trapa incisa]